jgi:hypothetical protein
MNFEAIEGLLLLNKAALFDASSLMIIMALLLWSLNVKAQRRLLASLSGWILICAGLMFAGLSLMEYQADSLAKAQHVQSPYLLSGYDMAH